MELDLWQDTDGIAVAEVLELEVAAAVPLLAEVAATVPLMFV